MRTKRVVGSAAICAMLWLQVQGVGSAEMRSGGAITKLGRGFINIVTGWVEIPKRVSETAYDQGAAAGWTWGMLRGLGYGFVRTAAGFYELFTFPFPAPPNYEPVIQPDYVFSSNE